MKKIPIRNRKKEILDYAIVDDDMYDELNQYCWHFSTKKYPSHTFHIRDGGKVRFPKIQMHMMVLPKKKGFQIDHINRNKLDNRRENLRYVTGNQNQWNMGLRKDNTSGYTGVSYRNTWRGKKRWGAWVTINGKMVGKKEFITKKEAIEHRKMLVKKYYGGFGNK